MAPNTFLFVNKHSNSPSLSRNTGSEAALASKVNKHVQQQRFWKTSGPRQNWYRPFVKDDDSTASIPSEVSGDVVGYESARSSPDRPRLTTPRKPSSSRGNSSLKLARSSPRVAQIKQECEDVEIINPSPRFVVTSRPGDSNDPFSITVVPITAALREALDRHLRWVVSSSVSNFAIHGAIPKIFQEILTHKMHSTAFLAMATAQQRKTTGMILPPDHSPEQYSYEATKLIREYIDDHPQVTDVLALSDIFRLAMTEWINGNPDAARIHFSYIARNFEHFQSRDVTDRHLYEVITSEDVFLAMDIDEQPLLNTDWQPDLPAGPYLPTESPSASVATGTEHGRNLLQTIAEDSPLRVVLEKCLGDLQSFPLFSNIDFASATAGPIWIAKRRIHATLHRLQNLGEILNTVDECIRRTLLILFLVSFTTKQRRIGRTDVPRMAMRLRNAISKLDTSEKKCTARSNIASESLSHLRLWMYMTGLAACEEASDTVDREEMHRWFTNRTISSVFYICGSSPCPHQLEGILSENLTFKSVHKLVSAEVCAVLREQLLFQSGSSNGHRVVQSLGFVL